MAEEKNETEQTTASSEPAGDAAKPAVKKKAAKKKVAKKAASRKAVAKKTAVPGGDAAASPPPGEPAVATRDSIAEKGPSRVEAVVKLKEQEPAEGTEMPSDTKTPGGFWLKVIFWLVVIVLGFIWIRSMAKHPGEEMGGVGRSEDQAVTATPNEAAPSRESSTVPAPSLELPSGTGEPPAGVNAPAAGPAESSMAPAPSVETGASGQTMESTSDLVRDEAAAPAVTRETAPVGGPRGESVSKILQEFDDLRNAARAEMEAMRNLIQAERDLREAMSPPPPAYPPPAWYGGYSPYAPAPPTSQDPYARP